MRSPLLYADLVHKSENLETFLTGVSTLPTTAQNKLMQEKLLLLHSKLVTSLEELQSVQEFHRQQSQLLKALQKSASAELSHQIDKSLSQISKFSQNFAAMLENPVSHSSIRSETEKMSESYDHNARFRKLYTDYSQCC